MKQTTSTRKITAGFVIGKLTAMEFIEFRCKGKDKRRRSYWRWRCDCGGEKIIQARFVLNQSILSCGCLIGQHGGNNIFYIKDNIGFCKLSGKSENKFFMFSPSDLVFVKRASWFLNTKGYVAGRLRGEARDSTYHRLILDVPNNFQVDHVNRNKLDNRRENLRIVTNSQNQSNRFAKGVYKTRNDKYSASIQYQKIRYHLGVFTTFEEAKNAYISKKNELCGEYSPYTKIN